MQDISRTIVISSHIDDDIVGEVIQRILDISQFDDDNEGVFRDYERKPIELFINSVGGSATAGFALCDVMRMSNTPIITFGVGQVCSVALAIYLSGDTRVTTKNTRFMYHSVAYGVEGLLLDHEEALIESKILQSNYDNLILDNSKLTKETLEKVIKAKKDFFISAEESVQYGMSDVIMEQREKVNYFAQAQDQTDEPIEEQVDYPVDEEPTTENVQEQ